MRILHVNTSDIVGGAARAAYRLHQALLADGVDSTMLVQKKDSDDFTVIGGTSKIKKGLGLLNPTLDMFPVKLYSNRSETLFSPAWLSSLGLVKRINAMNPDIVHLHWINGGMLRIEDLAKIHAPIVWSLHDMWALTGGCHYDENCGAYKKNCGYCKVLASNKEHDLSRWLYRRKFKALNKLSNLTVVGLSRWMAQCANESTLLSNQKVIHLPNPINTFTFAPFDKKKARELLNLPINKKLILFGAMGATSDPRKGFYELSQALALLDVDDAELIIFGSGKPKLTGVSTFKHKKHYLGKLYDDVTLRTLYSAADVMIVPSLQEAFGQTASEAMSCATPVVAFGTSGLLDIVDHKKNGYLATAFIPSELSKGIEWVLDADNYDQLCVNAREKVLHDFDSKIVSQKYIKLYDQIVMGAC